MIFLTGREVPLFSCSPPHSIRRGSRNQKRNTSLPVEKTVDVPPPRVTTQLQAPALLYSAWRPSPAAAAEFNRQEGWAILLRGQREEASRRYSTPFWHPQGALPNAATHDFRGHQDPEERLQELHVHCGRAGRGQRGAGGTAGASADFSREFGHPGGGPGCARRRRRPARASRSAALERTGELRASSRAARGPSKAWPRCAPAGALEAGVGVGPSGAPLPQGESHNSRLNPFPRSLLLLEALPRAALLFSARSAGRALSEREKSAGAGGGGGKENPPVSTGAAAASRPRARAAASSRDSTPFPLTRLASASHLLPEHASHHVGFSLRAPFLKFHGSPLRRHNKPKSSLMLQAF